MLTISKVFTSLSTLPLRGIARKKEGLFAVDKHRLIFLNYLLHVWVMLAILKVFIILFLLCLWESRSPK